MADARPMFAQDIVSLAGSRCRATNAPLYPLPQIRTWVRIPATGVWVCSGMQTYEPRPKPRPA